MAATTWDENSTTEDVLEGIDLKGLRVLITGVSSGLGVETARAAMAHGAQIVGTARDIAKAEAACAAFKTQGPGTLTFVELDLTSLKSVRACADALLKTAQPFDVVIANAGIMAAPLSRTEDGFESQFGTNHLGHFVFVNRLLPLLHAGSRPSAGRVVMLASRGHQISDIDLEDPDFRTTAYDAVTAYGRSKTANILFAVEFDRRHRQAGIRATALHPGGIKTGLGSTMTPEIRDNLMATSVKLNGGANAPRKIKSVEEGAATTVWAAFVAPAAEVGGRYCEDCHVAALELESGRGGVRPYALDPERAAALWKKSEELVGERFDA